jgi:hypothetical protein
MNLSEPSQKAKLDGLLEDWHRWSAGYSGLPTAGACAMFKDAKSPKHWDSTADIDDDIISKTTMDALDFAILGDKRGQGGMQEPHRTAVTFYARNLCAKVSVWHSPRLPACQIERVKVTNEALDRLSHQLKKVGVL